MDRDCSKDVSEASKKWVVEKECYDEITEYIRQVDEILDFIKPFPRENCPEAGAPLTRSISRTESSDHLENLIKLVEQLKDLKEKDSKTNERTQYLKDLKRLRERKKLLKCEAESGNLPAGFWKAEESDAQVKKCRSSLPFRKTNRARSKSVNMEDIIKDRFRRGRFPSEEGEHRRKISIGSQKMEKSKVSKWMKVKEAFRWEKASPEGKANRREDGQYLQVPQDKTPESLSDSPLSGQVSGSSSVGAPSTICLAVSSGYSGEHSSEGHSTSSGYDPPPPPAEEDFLSLPLLQDLSSSSSSEKLDELLTYSELLAQDSYDVAFHDHPEEARRSKSLDGDTILGPDPSLVQHLTKECLKASKTHKTAWGKVKDIIQTRKDSLKKRPKKRIGEGIDPEEDAEDKPREMGFMQKPKIELPPESSEEPGLPLCPKKLTANSDSVAKRRLTPVLTITLPSTEELRNIACSEGEHPPRATCTPDGKGKAAGENGEFIEDIPKYEKSKSGSYHKFSKWSKVKRAFLTSPSRSPDYVPEASSMPSSPNKQISFFSDVDSDELSSGEWTEEKVHEKASNVELESPGRETLQEEIQKRYLEHQKKLSNEFDQKLREWERRKSTQTKQDQHPEKQKSEDWDKVPRSPQRDSMAIPLPKLDELSPEFKKKLDEWKKIKKSQTISTVPAVKDESQGQHFKMRIGEWQKWRPRSGHKISKSDQSEEFAKKLEEWHRIKGTMRRSRSQSDRGKDDNGNRTPSPQLRRKNSKGTFKKGNSSGKSSGTESLSGSLKEKDGRGRKVQKEKDLQWLEKELHKIERGKMRLEREKVKFLEREARLEKMKRTMDTASPTQEVLIKTPTGYFRFEGISQKFTKKLYEWEKAKGIAPEASTFALLEECATQTPEDGRTVSLQRSKSMVSVMEAASVLPHHPSSLSLNDVDDFNVLEDSGGIDESRASSEPTLEGIGPEEDEPEAIIVDVEDVVEETAALMAEVPLLKGEVPVYSYAPSEVTQLIDSSGSENEVEIRVLEDTTEGGVGGEEPKPEVKSVVIRKSEIEIAGRSLEEAGTASPQHPRQTDPAEQQEAVTRVHQLSSQLLTLAEKLEVALSERNGDGKKRNTYLRKKQETEDVRSTEEEEVTSITSQELSQLPTLITNKVLELKCGLDVLKTASASPSTDMSVFEFPNKGERDGLIVEAMSPKKSEISDREKSFEGSKQENHRSPDMIKMKIKEKISQMQRMTTEPRPRNFRPLHFNNHSYEAHTDDESPIRPEPPDDVDEKVVVVRKNCKGSKQRKLLKTRRVTDTTIACKQVSDEKDDEMFITGEDGRTPVNVFVPTTRKIISPVQRDSKGTTSSVLSYVIDDISSGEERNKQPEETTKKSESGLPAIPEKRDIGIPPLPNSPVSPRKFSGKEAAPSIRMMIAKYNQKIESSDTGSASPVSWRSPVFDRRFQEVDPLKTGGKFTRAEVQKSASAGLIRNDEGIREVQESPKGILKSSSAGAIEEEPKPEPEPSALTLRALRIKKAKEEFLSRGPSGQSWTSEASTPTAEVPEGSRLSQVSVGSESSCDESLNSNLIKSASAGTINIEDLGKGSVEGRSEEPEGDLKLKGSSKFGISSIKSRFRKVRMKKAKEKMGAVSALCRQSLFLELPNNRVDPTPVCTSKSCPSSPVLERNRGKTESWIRNPAKIFKEKEPKPEVP